MGDLTGFLDVANGFIVLITGLVGLVGTGIGVYFAIKNWFAAFKTKTKSEKWSLLMEMADAAMAEAEMSAKSGEDKKTMVLDAIAAATKAAGIEAGEFTEQLSDYIDQTIAFVNKMKSTKQD
jgi:hypothetical protein